MMNQMIFPKERIEQAARYNGLHLARVVTQHKNLYSIVSEQGRMDAELPGSYLYTVRSSRDYPAVGDYVLVDEATSGGHAILHTLLERTSVFARKAAGETDDDQIIATNIDTVFICMSLNQDFNIRRLERYLAVAWESGAAPVILLTKADLCEDIHAKLGLVDEALSVPVPIFVVSASDAESYTALLDYLVPGKTVAFVGSSGVGKSTIINWLLETDVITTSGIRSDGKGRHTTVRRDLYVLPSGAMVIDTPGMRELGLGNAEIDKTFGDILSLAQGCRFADCRHDQEPGCAIRAAIEAGAVSIHRLESYNKLTKEAGYEGMNSKQIEQAKLARMYADFDGQKNAQKYIKSKRNHR